MAALTKREFIELALGRSNYLTWAPDVEIYFTSTELQDAIIADSITENHNQLLTRNHNAHPVGSTPVLEAHHVAQSSNTRGNRGRGRGRGHGRGPSRGGRNGGNKNHSTRNKQRQPENQGQSSSSNNHSGQQQTYYRCGCTGHWSRTCRTPKHFVEAYKQIMKRDEMQPKDESHHVALRKANALDNADDYDLMKYELEDFGDQE
ncbi:PREDICTED: uncharacterized protein LOC109184957 [Ipomoea nil]|uniref:uncharacterized protein LOC109184957 n=1 Tax=Ipomoea nil TaxID=35883 RepID=UPI000901929E|nr:PREDICTED: uncharacterized protein LOC109184957 [Ipomoea nil]